jgi:hypothetical protein
LNRHKRFVQRSTSVSYAIKYNKSIDGASFKL